MKRLLLTLIAMVAVLACGCGGFTASKSISPLDFLLPGLMHIGAPPAPLPAPSDAPQVPETLALAWTCCNPDPNSPFNGYWGEGLNVKPHVLTIETTSMGRTAPKDNIHPHSDLGSLALNSIF